MAGIVDIPNACTTLGLPIDIFDFDILPGQPVKEMSMGECAFAGGASEGVVVDGAGKNSEFSFGGGLTYKP